MFEDWKQAWREAVENFQREVRESQPGVPLRVRAMERELASAGGALTKLEQEIRRTRREAEKERHEETVCRRREDLARTAGDEETVRVAVEFAARHVERAELLERKTAVLEDERTLLSRDVDEMRRLLNEAAAAARTAAETTAPKQTEKLDERAFSRLEHEARDRAAEARLEELKKRMRG
jgi:phage shock protein A